MWSLTWLGIIASACHSWGDGVACNHVGDSMHIVLRVQRH